MEVLVVTLLIMGLVSLLCGLMDNTRPLSALKAALLSGLPPAAICVGLIIRIHTLEGSIEEVASKGMDLFAASSVVFSVGMFLMAAAFLGYLIYATVKDRPTTALNPVQKRVILALGAGLIPVGLAMMWFMY